MHSTVAQFLDKVWTSPTTRTTMPLQDLEDAIYDLYTPPPSQGTTESWTQVTYHHAPLNEMGWRVYISATPPSLKKVWDRLEPIFKSQPGVLAAKRTTPQAAATRVDTIVVYLRNAAARDALINAMRSLLSGRPGIGRAPRIPPKLQPTDFKPQIPPTTQPIPGMQGVSHAQQPIEDGWAEKEVPVPHRVSFGMQLASMVANAYRGAASRDAFFDAVSRNYLEEGMDINRPWQQLLSQANRDQLVASGNAARRRRGRFDSR